MKFIVASEIFLPWQYIFIFKIILTRSWIWVSTILAAYKNCSIWFRDHFLNLHDSYVLCRIVARWAGPPVNCGVGGQPDTGQHQQSNLSLGSPWTHLVSRCFSQPCWLQWEALKFFPWHKTVEAFLFLKLFFLLKYHFSGAIRKTQVAEGMKIHNWWRDPLVFLQWQ